MVSVNTGAQPDRSDVSFCGGFLYSFHYTSTLMWLRKRTLQLNFWNFDLPDDVYCKLGYSQALRKTLSIQCNNINWEEQKIQKFKISLTQAHLWKEILTNANGSTLIN
jgi:hypothetical protein